MGDEDVLKMRERPWDGARPPSEPKGGHGRGRDRAPEAPAEALLKARLTVPMIRGQLKDRRAHYRFAGSNDD